MKESIHITPNNLKIHLDYLIFIYIGWCLRSIFYTNLFCKTNVSTNSNSTRAFTISGTYNGQVYFTKIYPVVINPFDSQKYKFLKEEMSCQIKKTTNNNTTNKINNPTK